MVQIFFRGEIYEWIGRYTNELGFRFFFGIIFIYFIFSIGRLGFWNLKIYEWIGTYTNELGFGFFFGRYTNELEDIRMNWGSDFFWGENLRMNWKIYEWIGVQIFFGIINIYFIFSIGGLGFWNLKIYEWVGRYTNELGFRFFFGIINIYFIFSIGGLGFWNLKIYEWVGRYTNELGFRFFFGIYTNELEDIRMNWGSDFFSRENIRMNWKIYAWIGVQIFCRNIYEWIEVYPGGSSENLII